MITFVQFQKPVNMGAQGSDDWALSKHTNITCTDKGNHLLFEYEVNTSKGKVQKRTRVPLTNIAFVTEDVEPSAPKKAKGEAE